MDDQHEEQEKAPELPIPEAPVNNELAEWKRKAEEAERKVYEARRETDMLREQRLREMAVQPVALPAESDSDLNEQFTVDPIKAVRKIVDAEKKDIDQRIEARAREIYLREAKKIEAITKFPELRDPNSDFFKRVAFYMDSNPAKYHDKEGLMDACYRVSFETGKVPKSPEVSGANERVRQSVSSAASQVSGSGNAPVNDNGELDAKGLELATKLGIDPKVMAKRMQNYQEGKAEYAPAPGKTGKATFVKS